MTGVVVVHAEAVSWGHCATKRSRCRWNRVKGQVTLDPVWLSYLEFILRAVVAIGGVSRGLALLPPCTSLPTACLFL